MQGYLIRHAEWDARKWQRKVNIGASRNGSFRGEISTRDFSFYYVRSVENINLLNGMSAFCQTLFILPIQLLKWPDNNINLMFPQKLVSLDRAFEISGGRSLVTSRN